MACRSTSAARAAAVTVSGMASPPTAPAARRGRVGGRSLLAPRQSHPVIFSDAAISFGDVAQHVGRGVMAFAVWPLLQDFIGQSVKRLLELPAEIMRVVCVYGV